MPPALELAPAVQAQTSNRLCDNLPWKCYIQWVHNQPPCTERCPAQIPLDLSYCFFASLPGFCVLLSGGLRLQHSEHNPEGALPWALGRLLHIPRVRNTREFKCPPWVTFSQGLTNAGQVENVTSSRAPCRVRQRVPSAGFCLSLHPNSSAYSCFFDSSFSLTFHIGSIRSAPSSNDIPNWQAFHHPHQDYLRPAH